MRNTSWKKAGGYEGKACRGPRALERKAPRGAANYRRAGTYRVKSFVSVEAEECKGELKERLKEAEEEKQKEVRTKEDELAAFKEAKEKELAQPSEDLQKEKQKKRKSGSSDEKESDEIKRLKTENKSMKSSIKALGQNNTALEEITKLKEPTQRSDQEVVSVPEEGSYAYQDEELSEESQLCSRFGHTHSHCRGLSRPKIFPGSSSYFPSMRISFFSRRQTFPLQPSLVLPT